MTDAPVRFRVPGSSFDDYEGREHTSARERLHSTLMSALQLERLVVLCGSGTSICANGPTMWNLWEDVVGSPRGADAKTAMAKVKYAPAAGEENVEFLLSRCDAYLYVHEGDAAIQPFRAAALAKILQRCRAIDKKKLDAHKTFLVRLARRRVRDARVKLFTTNYDTCFEEAASRVSLIPIDGFSFTQPRRFDARFFDFDIVHRGRSSDHADFVPGVFQLFKLHGSVDWRHDGDDVSIDAAVPSANAALVYPAASKYQRSFEQPHLELMSHYLAALRQNNTCLLVAGFGFNDDHLARPILAAIEANPHFRVVIVDIKGEELLETAHDKAVNDAWRALRKFARTGRDITVIAANFVQFVDLMPDLVALGHGDVGDRALVARDGQQ